MSDPVVQKAILPVAGIGKRLRPLTLTVPKALVEVCGRPLLDYVLDELHSAGIREVGIVASPRHEARFRAYIRNQSRRFNPIKFHIRIQKEAYGSGHALICAEDLVRNEPFVVRFCDDLLFSSSEHPLKTLLTNFRKHRAPIFMLTRVPKAVMSNYGVVGIRRTLDSKLYEINRVVEKPRTLEELRNGTALSNLTVVGAYVLTPKIFKHIKKLVEIMPPLQDGFPITAAFNLELKRGGKVCGLEFTGVRLDCGTLGGLVKAESTIRSSFASA